MPESQTNNGRQVELKTVSISSPVRNRLVHTDAAGPDPFEDDAEIRFVFRSVLWMMVVAVAPLILLYVVCYFFPELLRIPATARQAGEM